MSKELTGEKIYNLAGRLFPICRSITGDGVRETFKILQDYLCEDIKIKIYEVESGSEAFDWTVPEEWVIRQAYIEDVQGNRIIDFKDNNLHVLGYSLPVDKWVGLEELKEYIYTEESQPDVIPYVTSYYAKRCGFCMSSKHLNSLKEGKYHMYIDSELKKGSLTYGEVVIPGKTEKEILFSTYICHPSMADNECSGPALMAELINSVRNLDRRYTYRFVMVPETIGSITYLSRPGNLEKLRKNVVAGFVLSCVGDDFDYSMIGSRYGNTLADRVCKNVIRYKKKFSIYDFHERGSDERQYNAPGIDLPVVCFCRSKFGEFPEYHTSADNMTFVSPEGFQGAYDACMSMIEILENNYYYKIKVLCEPQLGKRGLYSNLSRKGTYDGIMVQRDVIAYSDGTNNLLDLSERIGVPASEIIDIAERLRQHDLMEFCEAPVQQI